MSVEIPSPLVSALARARRVTVLTGAGISAESGLPTFRQAQTGLWAQYDPQELATPQAFRRNPRLVWDWYAWRRSLAEQAQPNAGHMALVRMGERVPQFTLVTQNVDSLHQRAGSPEVIELHGNIARTRCFRCGRYAATVPEVADPPPRCAYCDGLLRPDVVWFGESLPAGAMAQALAASRACDLFLSVGTSALVYPAASLPLEALQQDATAVEVNPEPTSLSRSVNYTLRGPAGLVLPALVSRAWPD